MSEPQHRDKPYEWQERARCKSLPSEWFFPERGENGLKSGGNMAKAKAACAKCPVTAECLEYAITPPVERSGIYGGMSSRERGQLRGRRVV